MKLWCLLLLLVPAWPAALPAVAAAAPAKPAATDMPTRSIAIVINGVALARDPAPRTVGGHLLVPVVRIYSALGIEASRDGASIVAVAPTKNIRITMGSSQASIDGRPVTMEAPATEIDGTTYVPLRFVAESLGANVQYDAKAAQVTIASALVGRNQGATQTAGDGRTVITGTVSAIDRNSSPATITVVRNGSARSIAINSEAKFTLEDVVAHTSAPGSMSDVNVGDALSITMNRDGTIAEVVSFFASRSGTVAAVSPSALVLQNGRVVTADKSTDITLNGAPATIGDFKPGDAITVRLNPETNENRQVIGSRSVAAGGAAIGATASPGPAPSGATFAANAMASSTPADTPAIESLTLSANRPLHAGENLDVTLRGTPGARAWFDVGTVVSRVPMRETAPGVYTGRFTIDPGVNFTSLPVFGHLAAGGVEAPRAESQTLVSASTIPPTIGDVAPPNGQTVNNPRPSIYATFGSPTDVGINPSSVQITVNGRDVTASATRTPTFITYSPPGNFTGGTVSVTVRVADAAGNVATRTWSFTVHL